MPRISYKTSYARLRLFMVLAAVGITAGALAFSRLGQHIQPSVMAADPNTIVVNSTADAVNSSDGQCTLREAITAANDNMASGSVPGECVAGTGDDTIVFDANVFAVPNSYTINLTGALPALATNITINGTGSSLLRVRRNTGGIYRIINVGGAANVKISGITITNGKTADGVAGNLGRRGEDGGGISNFGTLTLTDVTISGNVTGKGGDGGIGAGQGGFGGGIYNSGNLTMINCTVSGNVTGKGGQGGSFGGVGGDGGGIYSDYGKVTLIDSTISNNTISNGPIAGGQGGGIFNNVNSTIQLTRSVVSGNTCHGSGGGILNDGVMNVMSSTVSGNKSFDFGGGISNDAGKLTLTNSTISGNQGSFGGGITHSGSQNTITVTNCTITNNSSANSGGGIYTFSNRSVTVKNTIVAGNNGGTDIRGQFTSQGYNLIGSVNASDGSGFTNGLKHDQVGTAASPLNPQLSQLGDYGGPTRTHLLLSGSPAIDTGSNANLPPDTVDLDSDNDTAETLPVDQRGYPRVVNGTVDIGAVEVGDLNYAVSVTAGNGQSARINTAFATQLKVTVRESGNPQSGIPVTFTAPASGASGTFAGSATVMTDADGVALAPVFTANGIVGSYPVIASIPGDVPSVTFSLTNTKGQAQITLGNLSHTFDGTPKPVSVTTLPSGLTVSVTYNGSPAAPSSAGSYQVTAIVEDDNYAGQVKGTLTINKAAQTITFPPIPNKTFGNPGFTISATASSSLGVSFTASGKCTVSDILVQVTGTGSCTITASQAGNSNYNAAPNVSRTFSITKAAGTPVLTSSVNPSESGQNVTFTASVPTVYGGTPTGTVQFKVDGTNAGTPLALNASGMATFSTSTLTVGTHTITAVYSGDVNFNAGTGTLSSGQVVKSPPKLSIDDRLITEGNAGTKNLFFTVTLWEPSSLPVKVNFATANGTATAGSDYQATSGTLTFNPFETVKTITIVLNADTANEPDETFLVKLSSPQNATISKAQGTGSILNDDAPRVQIATSSYTIDEDASNTLQGFGSLPVTIRRTGDASVPVTVQYSTSDTSGGAECDKVTGQASQRCDYTLVNGTLRFAEGETTKTINIPIINDGYVENTEFFSIELKNPVGATLDTINQATIAILDDDTTATSGAQNPYLLNTVFVRMNYLDFLGREPDTEGWSTWPAVLATCGPEKGFIGASPECDRAHVSHGFFGSPEFTDTGFLIYRLYEVGMGRLPRYTEFTPDMASLSGFGLTDDIKKQNLSAYLQQFTAKQEFQTRFAGTLLTSQAAALIQKLEQTAGVTLPSTATTLPGQPPQYGRQELIIKRQTGQLTLGQTVKAFVEQKIVYDKYFPRGQVTMLYFAYLKRDPDLNDPTLAGWTEWVFVFTNGGAARGRPDIQPRDIHHLIFGFIYSEEYRKRFGAP